MIWVNALTGIFLSVIYVVATIRIWQRRSKWWALLALGCALAFMYPTATYIWQAFHGTARTGGNPVGLLLFILPALLTFRLIAWWIRDEADTRSVIEHLSE